MPQSRGELEGSPPPSDKKYTARQMREMMFVAEQAAEGGLRVLPSSEWALHYPVDPAVRAEKLQGLLRGKYKPEEVASDIALDTVLYSVEDIATLGIETVSARIRDLSAFIVHYDYPRFAQFVASMRGREIPIDQIVELYGQVTQTRVQKQMIDAFSQTGRRQIEGALRLEATNTLRNETKITRSQKVLQTLKMHWMCETLGVVSPAERDQAIAGLSGQERQAYQRLEASYRQYVQSGDEAAYQQLLTAIQEEFPFIQQEVGGEKPSTSMQELQAELDPLMDRVGPPGSENDPAIPPEDSDEYHTPPPAKGESKEKMRVRPIFEIDPPLGGYYAGGRKSYFDLEARTWSKKKQLTPYAETLSGGDRHTIRGRLEAGVKSLPLPTSYAVDAGSLQASGATVELRRDQNGCFYLEVQGQGEFAVDFVRAPAPFVSSPIPEDRATLYRGRLGERTEGALTKLIGSPLQKAEQARQHLLANHFYPGGGDLDTAQALQYKLRTESTGDDYIQHLDQSEYLECYSANTLFIALMRQAGVPARLVIGHKVTGATAGKSAITQSTGHAWAEIWDGQAWRRFDATPRPKPEDKKTDQQSESADSAPEANDNGVEAPQSTPADKQGKPSATPPGQQKSPSTSPTETMGDASDVDVEQAASEFQQAQERFEQQQQQQQAMDQKIQQAEKFKDVTELKNALEQADLDEEMKKELEEKLRAKTEEMKEAIREELDKMVEDGFLDEDKRREIEDQLNQLDGAVLDQAQQEITRENSLYLEYEDIREEVRPLVEKWFRYFAERLPHQDEVSIDEDSLTRQGAFNRRSVMKPRNLVFGLVKNPREIKPSFKPRFMASILVDVSGSMAQAGKLMDARKLLVFYAELFTRISEEFGYLRFSIDIFSDSVKTIKSFEQEYDSPKRYDFPGGESSTVKVRLMKQLTTQGGTNMLTAIQHAAEQLQQQTEQFPDYASALYFIGDGGDTRGNAANIRQFLNLNSSTRGFGEHMYSAILLGGESQRRELADIFGDEHTNVAPDFDTLIEQSMDRLEGDLEDYLSNQTQ